MTELDCRGLACPQPVLNTKDALDQMDSGQLRIIVDNQAARDNVTRFASSQGCRVEAEEQAGLFVLTVTKGEAGEAADSSPAPQVREPVIVVKITNPFMGSGSEELGRILMKAFLKTLSDATHKPTALVFYNSGIHLTCNGSENLESLRALEKLGVKIFSCGTCLDFFNKKEELAVGLVTNMFEIVETLSNADRVVSPQVLALSDLIYCDQAATSFPKPPEVVAAVCNSLTDFSASPGRSGHRFALAASRIIFEARENMAELLGVDDSSQIVFTANVTQALNMALAGYLHPGDHVLTSALEHNSVMRPLTWLAQKLGLEVEVAPLAPTGLVDPAQFSARIKAETRLVVVNHASNVTGALAPLAELKAAIGPVPLLVDGAQSAGSVPLDNIAAVADMFAFTGHKALLGPTGTGGLWVKPGLELTPLLRGGTGSRSEKEEQPEFMPDALEAGTPNTHGLAGLAAGLGLLLQVGVPTVRDHELRLLSTFLTGLASLEGVQLYGPAAAPDRVAVVSLNLAGWSPSDLARKLESDHGILTRPGLHCAPRAHRTLGTWPVGTVRFSFGYFNTDREVKTVLEALEHLSHHRP